MYSGYRTIFWGYFFATFHINLGMLQILPAFVGWIMISAGIAKIANEMKTVRISRATTYASLLVVLSIVSGAFHLINPNMTNNYTYNLVATILFAVIELMTEITVMEESIDYLYRNDQKDKAESLNRSLRKYSDSLIVNTILMCIALTLLASTFLFLLGIIGVLLRIWYMRMISNLKNLYPEVEATPPSGDEPNSFEE